MAEDLDRRKRKRKDKLVLSLQEMGHLSSALKH
jgi:hypothetical protein